MASPRKSDLTVNVNMDIDAHLAEMNRLVALDEKTNCDKALQVSKNVVAMSIAASTAGFVFNSFAGEIPYGIGDALVAANDATNGALSASAGAGFGRSLASWDPAADMTPSRDAGKWKKFGMYLGKYAVKSAILGGVAYGINYLNETFVKPLLDNSAEAQLLNATTVSTLTAGVSTALELVAVKGVKAIVDRCNKPAATPVAVSKSGMFAAKTAAESKQPLLEKALEVDSSASTAGPAVVKTPKNGAQ